MNQVSSSGPADVGAGMDSGAGHTSASALRLDPHEDCVEVLDRVYEFLDHELDTATDDVIRHHLDSCEPCLDRFDVEQAVKALVARHCGGETAPDALRAKVLGHLANARTRAAEG